MYCVLCHVLCVACNVLHVACCVSPVTCHLSLTSTAKDKEHPPSSFPIMLSRLVCTDPNPSPTRKNINIIVKEKNIRIYLEVSKFWRYTLPPEVSIPPGSKVSTVANTNTHTQMTHKRCNLDTESAQWAESLKSFSLLFKASALWADAFYKSKCPSVCVFVCSLLRYRLTVFLPPLPEFGCPIFLEIWNPWGKVMERSGLTFEHFCLEMV